MGGRARESADEGAAAGAAGGAGGIVFVDEDASGALVKCAGIGTRRWAIASAVFTSPCSSGTFLRLAGEKKGKDWAGSENQRTQRKILAPERFTCAKHNDERTLTTWHVFFAR